MDDPVGFSGGVGVVGVVFLAGLMGGGAIAVPMGVIAFDRRDATQRGNLFKGRIVWVVEIEGDRVRPKDEVVCDEGLDDLEVFANGRNDAPGRGHVCAPLNFERTLSPVAKSG